MSRPASANRLRPVTPLSPYTPTPTSPRPPSQSGYRKPTPKNITVAVRVRPPLQHELADPQYTECVAADPENMTVTVAENLVEAAQSNSPLFGAYSFQFDHVFSPSSNQGEVYDLTGKAAVNAVLSGYNATVIAYGQTGTGKTHTMEGNLKHPELRGIIPRSLSTLFQTIHNSNKGQKFLVRASYFQIYNESVSDLLMPDRINLQIREDKKRGIHIENLSEWVVRNEREVFNLMQRGNAIRVTHTTKMNESSSRSHSIFQLIVEQTGESNEMEATAGVQSFKVGKLNLVDLAGSERVAISGAKGVQLKESQYINSSLSNLAHVISSLVKNQSFIPYRDSKLTRILADSLGGNTCLCLIGMISPTFEHYAENISTLKFLSRAKKINHAVKMNETIDTQMLLKKYERELTELRRELDLRSQTVIDRRQWLEAEERRKQAEQDKDEILRKMEEMSLDLLNEKSKKKRLEDKIKNMQSQLLNGGVLKSTVEEVLSLPAVQMALAEEEERIRKKYEKKWEQSEKGKADEEKLQRYREVVVKQRELLNQMAEKIKQAEEKIAQAEQTVSAKDNRIRALEDDMDRRRMRMIKMRRNGADMDDESAEESEDSANNNDSVEDIGVRVVVTPSEQPNDNTSSTDIPHTKPRQVHKSFAMDQRPEERQNLEALERLVMEMQQKEAVKEKEIQHYHNEWEKKWEESGRERAALETILEKKVKVLVDNIEKGVEPLQQLVQSAGIQSSDVDLDMVRKQVNMLHRLVNASILAMKSSPNHGQSSSTSTPSNTSTNIRIHSPKVTEEKEINEIENDVTSGLYSQTLPLSSPLVIHSNSHGLSVRIPPR